MSKKNIMHITALADHGEGLAQQDGRSHFIAGALPNEIWQQQESGWVMQQASPQRTDAQCPHFSSPSTAQSCGGCQMQHATAFLDQWQQERVLRHMQKAGVLLQGATQLPTARSPKASRRRAQLAAIHSADGLILGFHAASSKRIINLSACAVLAPQLMAALPALRSVLVQTLPRGAALDIHLTLADNGLDACLVGGTKPKNAGTALAPWLSMPNLVRLSWQAQPHALPELLFAQAQPHINISGVSVKIPPASFLQATLEGEIALRDFALLSLKQSKAKKPIELFCGVGSFSLALAGTRPLVCYDNNAPAIAALTLAAKQALLPITAKERDLFRAPVLREELNNHDWVLLDPPRAGATAQITQIIKSDVKDVVMLSCDLGTAARDLADLQQGSFKVTEWQIIDQFLWSNHIELAVALERPRKR